MGRSLGRHADTPLRRAGLVAAGVAALLTVPHLTVLAAPAGPGTIAYLSDDRREVRLIEPDGTGDRLLWATDGPEGFGIEDVAWRPDGQELAIASAHEAACSVWGSDLYRLSPSDGAAPRRITNAPGCGELGGHPTGSVSVELVNGLADQSIFVVYVQGAPAAQVVTLQPGFQQTVVFEGVADLGDGVSQAVSATVGSTRWLDPAAAADVVAGGTADAGTLLLSSTAYDTYGALTASWNPAGTRLAFQLGQGVLWSIDADPGVLGQGSALFAAGGQTVAATDPVWSPVGDEIAYHRFDTDPFSIEVALAGEPLPGTQWATTNQAHGIAWLPDGSGLVVADDGTFADAWTNLYLLSFADATVTQLTRFPDGEHAWWPSVSPDGTRVVFTHITGDPSGPDATTELRILELATGAMTTIHDGGLHPAWGSADLVAGG